MKLNINDRLNIIDCLPSSSDFKTINICKEIISKVLIDKKEQKEIGMTKSIIQGNTNYNWNSDKEKEKNIEFGINELGFLRKQIDRLDKEKKITLNNIDSYNKIMTFKGVKI